MEQRGGAHLKDGTERGGIHLKGGTERGGAVHNRQEEISFLNNNIICLTLST